MTIPFINETESKATEFRQELLEQLKQSSLVTENNISVIYDVIL